MAVKSSVAKGELPRNPKKQTMISSSSNGSAGNYQAKRTALKQKASWGVHEVLNPETTKTNRYYLHIQLRTYI